MNRCQSKGRKCETDRNAYIIYCTDPITKKKKNKKKIETSFLLMHLKALSTKKGKRRVLAHFALRSPQHIPPNFHYVKITTTIYAHLNTTPIFPPKMAQKKMKFSPLMLTLAEKKKKKMKNLFFIFPNLLRPFPTTPILFIFSLPNYFLTYNHFLSNPPQQP